MSGSSVLWRQAVEVGVPLNDEPAWTAAGERFRFERF